MSFLEPPTAHRYRRLNASVASSQSNGTQTTPCGTHATEYWTLKNLIKKSKTLCRNWDRNHDTPSIFIVLLLALHVGVEPVETSGYSHSLWATEFRARIRSEWYFLLPSKWAPRSTQPPDKYVPGLLPQGRATGAWRWSPTHTLLAPRLCMGEAAPRTLHCAFRAVTGWPFYMLHAKCLVQTN